MISLHQRNSVLRLVVFLACGFAINFAGAQTGDLLSAANGGDVAQVKALLARGVQVNAAIETL